MCNRYLAGLSEQDLPLGFVSYPCIECGPLVDSDVMTSVVQSFPNYLRLESLHFLCSSNGAWQLWRLNDVAAFCACCGAEITLKAKACPACGSPQHGMLEPDLLLPFDGGDSTQEDAESAGGLAGRYSGSDR
jgi:DNA-directed RNA polymerase subunit RPC12/RpoP